ncbi:MAG: type II toxin-antitoxin system Phd/YefM family antitoxin [Ignavibacteriae bacterium]|nr:type II toxin-antitoxin system Phd/YefM family antitoxin [Ignavibacteriota bacterium]
MLTKTKMRKIKDPEVIYKRNNPVSVITDISEYKEMLERSDVIEDINYIESLKNKSLKFRKLDDFLNESN